MIGKVSGQLDHRGADYALIETAGGRRLPAGLLGPDAGGAAGGRGEPVALYAEMVVREDLMQLIGFRTLAEREWWRLLVTVQGVGAKAALAILGTLGAEGVARALSLGDVSAIKAAPGVGPKLAQRVVLELKAKAPAVMAMGAAGARPATVAGTPATLPERAPAAAPAAPVASAPARARRTGRMRCRRWSISAMARARRRRRSPVAEGDGRRGADPRGAAGAGAEGVGRWRSDPALRPRGAARGRRPGAPAADARRVRRAEGGAGEPRGLHRERAAARAGDGPRAVLRAAGPRQDHAGADHGARARGELPDDQRAGAGAGPGTSRRS